MFGVTRGLYYCNDSRIQELNKRIYDRNIPSQQLQASFDPRSVETRYVRFPGLDCHKPSDVNIKHEPNYSQSGQFNPGTSAPYSGYATNVDAESELHNSFMANQKWTAQTQFIPSSKSDLYNTNVTTSRPVQMTHAGLFQQETFAPFNPNPCNIGHKLLYNHTRQQVMNLTRPNNKKTN